MAALATYTLTLKTLSPLILSPRASFAFYRDALLDESDAEYFAAGTRSYNIIYPAYRYGTYERFNPGAAAYHIPGSAIKGALTSGTDVKRGPLSLMVDDVAGFGAADYQVISPRKSQYFEKLPGEKDWDKRVADANRAGRPATAGIKLPQLLPFFDGTVGIEVLRAGIVFDVTVRYKDDLDALLQKTRAAAAGKLDRYWKQLTDYRARIDCLWRHYPANDREQCERALNGLGRVMDFVEALRTQTDGTVFSLGGFKGLLRSLNQEAEAAPGKSAIFVDDDFRPFGYVQILEPVQDL